MRHRFSTTALTGDNFVPMSSTTAVVADQLVPTYDCPTCKKQIAVLRKEDAPYRPFCSERCKMVDLGRWLDGTYKVSEPAKPEDLEQAADGADQAG